MLLCVSQNISSPRFSTRNQTGCMPCSYKSSPVRASVSASLYRKLPNAAICIQKSLAYCVTVVTFQHILAMLGRSDMCSLSIKTRIVSLLQPFWLCLFIYMYLCCCFPSPGAVCFALFILMCSTPHPFPYFGSNRVPITYVPFEKIIGFNIRLVTRLMLADDIRKALNVFGRCTQSAKRKDCDNMYMSLQSII